jgi:hypothetical protein
LRPFTAFQDAIESHRSLKPSSQDSEIYWANSGAVFENFLFGLALDPLVHQDLTEMA